MFDLVLLVLLDRAPPPWRSGLACRQAAAVAQGLASIARRFSAWTGEVGCFPDDREARRLRAAAVAGGLERGEGS